MLTVINLKAQMDFYQVIETGYTYPISEITSSEDTSAYGTNFHNNITTIKTDIDSTTISYDRKLVPYGQKTQINIISPRFTKVLYYEFKDMSSDFSMSYMNNLNDKVIFEVPAPYELANIVFALTASRSLITLELIKSLAIIRKYRNILEHTKITL